jgi:hypothetical protein
MLYELATFNQHILRDIKRLFHNTIHNQLSQGLQEMDQRRFSYNCKIKTKIKSNKVESCGNRCITSQSRMNKMTLDR